MQAEKLIENQIDARILYKNCPLCESDKIINSAIGNCSKQWLYNPKLPTKMTGNTVFNKDANP